MIKKFGFSKKLSFTIVKLSIETLMEEIKLIVVEKEVFNFR